MSDGVVQIVQLLVIVGLVVVLDRRMTARLDRITELVDTTLQRFAEDLKAAEKRLDALEEHVAHEPTA